MSFSAKYRSRCGACDEQIEVGDDCTYDDEDNVVHSRCLILANSGVPKEVMAEKVCPDCWLIHSGECP